MTRLKLPALDPADRAGSTRLRLSRNRFDAPHGRSRSSAASATPAVSPSSASTWSRSARAAQSALRHWHTLEDEFVYVLSGEVVLVTDAGEQTLRAGHVRRLSRRASATRTTSSTAANAPATLSRDRQPHRRRQTLLSRTTTSCWCRRRQRSLRTGMAGGIRVAAASAPHEPKGRPNNERY